jgi:hypothetical protein
MVVASERVEKYSLRKNYSSFFKREGVQVNFARLEQRKAKVTNRHFASVLLSVHIKFATYLPKKKSLEK